MPDGLPAGRVLATDFQAMDWFKEPTLRELLDALNAEGACTRIVGGAVRNALLDRPIDDIDLATTLLPEEARAVASAAGFKTIDTGLSHGTITAVRRVDDQVASFEITTLRHDVETFGRHARVAFTKDWSADATRRDFTMNAIYVDHDGTLHDPVGGLHDLKAGQVRFVGNPEDRIEEDFLRVLRFFRFSATHGNGVLDPEGLAACGRKRAGLAGLSAERIHKELLRLLVAPFACVVLRAMKEQGVLDEILGPGTKVDNLCRLAAIEEWKCIDADPIRRLGVLLPEAADPELFKKRLRLSNSQADALVSALKTVKVLKPPMSDDAVAATLYTHGRRAVLDGGLIAWASSAEPEDDLGWRELCACIDNAQVPVFPVAGRDLIDRGVPEGPELGHALRRLEAYWLERGCNPGKSEVLAQLDTP